MLPNLFVIGAMKCGTSSIHEYLNLHPEIYMSEKKELDFFVEEMNWGKGIDWYKKQFPRASKILGESSTNYTKYPLLRNVAQKIYEHCPDAKIIYLVRDPYKRIISHYIHNVSEGTENRSLENKLSDGDGIHYINTSKYRMQLQQYLKYFNEDQIHIIQYERLISDPFNVMRKVFRFLGVDDNFSSQHFIDIHHSSFGKTMPTEISKYLRKYRVNRVIRKIMPSFIEKPIITPQLTSSLKEKFYQLLIEDISEFRKYTGWPLMEWIIFHDTEK